MAGNVVHFEIPIDDNERGVAFYRQVFGWSLDRWGDTEYWTTSASDEAGIGGALTPRGDLVRAPMVYIDVDDVDVALDAIVAAGGTKLTDRMAIPTVGWTAFFEDTEGNRVGLFRTDEAAQATDTGP